MLYIYIVLWVHIRGNLYLFTKISINPYSTAFIWIYLKYLVFYFININLDSSSYFIWINPCLSSLHNTNLLLYSAFIWINLDSYAFSCTNMHSYELHYTFMYLLPFSCNNLYSSAFIVNPMPSSAFINIHVPSYERDWLC